jgi:glycosyltransferase involved in cell wall biosynthesis
MPSDLGSFASLGAGLSAMTESSTGPMVSVIIPHYRDLKALDKCLDTLSRQTLPRGEFEIIVADNNSPEGEAAIAEVIGGRARLVIVPEKGAGPARNGGVAAAKGQILAFVDSDCQAEPDWLAEGVKALSSYDFVGGRVKVLVDDPRKMTSAEAFERVFAFDFKTYITRKGFTGSGNLFCPRAMFQQVGGFSKGVSEDVEWSHRATAAGYRLGYAPKAVVGHPARRTFAELVAKWKRVNDETYGLMSRRKGGRLLWVLRTCALPASAVAHTPRVLLSKELDSFGQRLLALRMLYGLRLWRALDSFRLIAPHGRG